MDAPAPGPAFPAAPAAALAPIDFPAMKELLIFLGVFALWFVLQRWVLPAFGVPT